jgi:FkbM family methyltransferase
MNQNKQQIVEPLALPKRFRSALIRLLFWAAVKIGRPFGGIRPHRIVHWLAQVAYGDCKPDREKYKIYRDRYGNKLWLHPHYFIDYQIIAFGIYEPGLHRLFTELVRPGAICLDVGANIGDTTVNLLRLVGSEGRVFAFEPVPHLFRQLEENIALNSLASAVSLHRIALSKETGTSKIGIAEQGYTNQGMAALHNEGPLRFSQTIDIETVTLDDFVQTQKLVRIDLIKIDIQGAESWFFEGGKSTLLRFKPDLLFEVSPSDLKAFGLNSVDLLKSVENLGYNCYYVSKHGKILDLIHIESIGEDFEADEVYCAFQKEFSIQ